MNGWLVLGFVGQILFGTRFLVQWISSEIKKESHIPIVFWYFSIGGGLILFTYAIHIKDPVFILGQSMGIVVYARNLRLIYKKEQLLKKQKSLDINGQESEGENENL